MKQTLLMLQYRPGIVPDFVSTAAQASHDEAVKSVVAHVNDLVSTDELAPEEAKAVISGARSKKTCFTVYLLLKSGIVRCYSWGKTAYATSSDMTSSLSMQPFSMGKAKGAR